MNDKVSLEEYLELLNKYEELRGNLIHRNNEYYVLKDDHNQLQSNWNSLREELYQANRELVPNELVNGKELINNILNKYEELEGKDKDGK